MASSFEEIDAAVQPAGRFRLYLGSAPGVGKTSAMLDEGRRRHRRGTDVVIGFVETQGRALPNELTADLEVVPRKSVQYRGATFSEMDLDAVLARGPELALVDELAHTNAPGSGRHEKRWQDVLELLDNDIAVVSTVNIQHLDSLADVVEGITGAPVRERVPEWVVRKADQIELIDSSPEELRRRMASGQIYPPERAADALRNFFRADNLAALRELALRFVADEAEEELLAYLLEHHPDVLWDTTERILVAVTTAPGSEGVIGRAAKMAARAKAELHVVHVRAGEETHRSDTDVLGKMHRLADELGAQWHELKGDDAARVLVDFARENQITQIVLGSSRQSRWSEITRGSVAQRVLREASASGVDVHVIARRDAFVTPSALETAGGVAGRERT